jgi:hypothetical protein
MTYSSITVNGNSVIVSFKGFTKFQLGRISKYMALYCHSVSLRGMILAMGTEEVEEFSVLLENVLLFDAAITEFETMRQKFFPQLEPFSKSMATPAATSTAYGISSFYFAKKEDFAIGQEMEEPHYSLRELQKQMACCIEQEAYEKAAEIRDQIAKAKNENESILPDWRLKVNL